MREDPNPVWMRELRQAARLGRTPIILAVVTGMMTLLIASIGGIASATAEPAKVGVALFHTFFSLAFAVVAWVAPAVAASTIASERSGSTWEALLLTGLGAPSIARGKFLASLTYIGLYIVMLAPVGALPFLFGGVTATEVVSAFALLMLFAVLAVAFGLSRQLQVLELRGGHRGVAAGRRAAVASSCTLAAASALSYLAHSVWPGVPEGPPVWLPTAYARADFGLEYLVFLVLTPLTIVALPAWFLYEVTVANMAGPSDDRSSGLRRWFLVSALVLAVVAILPAFVEPGDRWAVAATGMGATEIFLAFSAFVFAGEPLGPSRRVRVHWDREGAGRLRRYLGPGLMRAMSLLLLLGLVGLLLESAGGVAAELLGGSPSATQNVRSLLAFGGYAAGFFVFVVGFTAWVRARSTASTTPRLAAARHAVPGPHRPLDHNGDRRRRHPAGGFRDAAGRPIPGLRVPDDEGARQTLAGQAGDRRGRRVRSGLDAPGNGAPRCGARAQRARGARTRSHARKGRRDAARRGRGTHNRRRKPGRPRCTTRQRRRRAADARADGRLTP